MGLLSGMMGGAAAGGGAAGPVAFATDGAIVGRWAKTGVVLVGSSLTDGSGSTTTTPNGTTAAVFDSSGGAQQLQFQTTSTAPQPFTIAAYAKVVTGGQPIFALGAFSSSPRIIVGGGTIRVGAGTARDTGLAVASTGDWGIWVARFDGATTTFHYNGTQYGGSLDGGTNTGNQVICNQNSTAETRLAELIVYTGTGNPDEYFADAYAS